MARRPQLGNHHSTCTGVPKKEAKFKTEAMLCGLKTRWLFRASSWLYSAVIPGYVSDKATTTKITRR